MPRTRSMTKEKGQTEVNLPTEMVYQVLQHLDFEDLLKLRCVKRSWNDAACRLIRKDPQLQTVQISNYALIQRLLTLQATALQPSFLAKFSLILSELNISSITQFGQRFGHGVRELTLDTRKKSSTLKRMRCKVHELLSHCQRVESLTIIGMNDGTSFIEDLDETLDLSSVRSLTLKSPYDPVLSVIGHSVVTGWVTRLRNLSTLIVATTLDPAENGHLERTLVQVGAMDHFSICLRFKPEDRNIFRSLAAAKIKLHALNLVVDMDEDDDQNLLFLNLYTWLAWQGRYLERVTHQLHTQITDGPILDTLLLLGQPLRSSGRSAQPFRNGQACSLYFVSLLSNDPSEPAEPDTNEPTLGILANMQESIISINKKTSKILKYLFPNMRVIHSKHYFVT